MVTHSSKSLTYTFYTYLSLLTFLPTYLVLLTTSIFCMQLSKNSDNLTVNREIRGVVPLVETAED